MAIVDEIVETHNNKTQDSDGTTPASVSAAAENEPADFEKAIDAAGFGLFNLILLIVAIPCQLGSMYESSTMSYILPIAECDLKLSLVNKGVLNAVTYAGMIASAIIWGYLADIKGRKKILVYGYLVDAVFVFGSSLSQNFQMLVVFKFLGGFVVNGPGAVIYTYFTELHGAKYRPRVLMVIGVITSAATTTLPLLAWAIFPRDWNFVLFNSLNVHTWQIFLAVCALPSLVSGLILIWLPESPKFLMSQGRNAEALSAFQQMYAINTRQPKDTYPIRALVDEITNRKNNTEEAVYTIEEKPAKKLKSSSRSSMESFIAGMQQIKPMFRKPLLGRSLQCYTMQFCILLGLNTIRLWLPQLFASTAEYESEFGTTANLCTILAYSANKTANAVKSYDTECTAAKNVSVDMYINNIIVSISGFIGYFFAGAIVRAIGSRTLLSAGLFISAGFGIGLYWSSSGLMTVIISSTYITIASVSTSSLLGLVVALFPTQLRTLIVAITMMCGRLGALSGNILFPILVEIGCIPPFLMVCMVLLCSACLSLLLANPNKEHF